MTPDFANITGVQHQTAWGNLQCKPCAIYDCVKQINCKGGKLRGACNCCDICAKVEGEICGGKFYRFGHCDKGLSCNISAAKYPFSIGKYVREKSFS